MPKFQAFGGATTQQKLLFFRAGPPIKAVARLAARWYPWMQVRQKANWGRSMLMEKIIRPLFPQKARR